MRVLLFFLLFTFISTANMDLYPKKECGLFNNLKHTKNRGQEVLKLDRTYEMLKHHKGQYLLKVEYATPVQRWIDDDCLSLRPLRGTVLYEAMQKAPKKPKVEKTTLPKTINIEDELRKADANMLQKPMASKQNLLALSWHNAFCETHRNKKECKRKLGDIFRSKSHEQEFVLHGLWPQPRKKVYCNVDAELIYADKGKRWRDLPCLALEEDVEKALAKVMPGFASDLHKHEWVKHGTCYGTDANRYYAEAISLTKQVNSSKLGQYFKENMGKYIRLKELRNIANRTFGRGTGEKISLQCKGGLVTELWLQLGTGSQDLGTLLQRGKKSYSRCKGGRIDKAGFGR